MHEQNELMMKYQINIRLGSSKEMLKCLQKQNIMGNNRRCAETLQSYSLPPKTAYRAAIEDITFMCVNNEKTKSLPDDNHYSPCSLGEGILEQGGVLPLAFLA